MKNDQVTSSESYSDDKFKIINFTGPQGNFRRISTSREAICLLPFDVNENNQIKHVYLAKYHDYVLDDSTFRCLTSSLVPDEFSTYHESLTQCIDGELGLDDVEANDIFYLGQIQHTVPFTKSYKCYAINLTKYSEDPAGFTPSVINPDDKLHTVTKVRFSRVMNGEVTDSLALSSSLLLLSYISE